MPDATIELHSCPELNRAFAAVTLHIKGATQNTIMEHRRVVMVLMKQHDSSLRVVSGSLHKIGITFQEAKTPVELEAFLRQVFCAAELEVDISHHSVDAAGYWHVSSHG